MATYGKYQVYYEKIKTEAEKIREENGYLKENTCQVIWEMFRLLYRTLRSYA